MILLATYHYFCALYQYIKILNLLFLKERDKRYRVLLHFLVFLSVLIPPANLMTNFDLTNVVIFKVSILFAIVIPLCIFNLTFLIPNYLKKQKYWQYLSGFILVIFFYYFIILAINPFNSQNFFLSYGPTEGVQIPMKSIMRPPFMPFLLLAIVLGTTLETLLDWERRGKIIERTEKEKLAAELSFLKSQINPHFFFNTLNSIYALVETDSLMRYILYDSNVEKVALTKEIQFLKDFIDLHKLRFTKSRGEKVEFKYYGNITNYKIEPLLLAPFVENAFKHSFSYKKESEVLVSIKAIENERLVFKVSNTIGDHTSVIKNRAGIGLENIKRRLNLIYPDKHQLELDRTDDHFNVTLRLDR